MNRDLDYVLNYMTKYVKDIYMHDSEPMLNYKDIEIVLKHIYELQQRIDKAIETLEKRIEENEEIDYVDMTGKSYINYQKEIIDILRGNDE